MITIPATGEVKLLSDNATTQDVANAMLDIIRAMKYDNTTIKVANILMQSNNAEAFIANLARYAYNQMYFEPDPADWQKIRTPRRSLIDERANCVDYSVFICSIANAVGMPCKFRIVQLPGTDYFGHVYPIVNDRAIDLIPLQREDGLEYQMRQKGIDAASILGQEIPYIAKQDFFI